MNLDKALKKLDDIKSERFKGAKEFLLKAKSFGFKPYKIDFEEGDRMWDSNLVRPVLKDGRFVIKKDHLRTQSVIVKYGETEIYVHLKESFPESPKYTMDYIVDYNDDKKLTNFLIAFDEKQKLEHETYLERKAEALEKENQKKDAEIKKLEEMQNARDLISLALSKLPDLKGTPKQVAWALEIRESAYKKDPTFAGLKKATKAKYWIDKRGVFLFVKIEDQIVPAERGPYGHPRAIYDIAKKMRDANIITELNLLGDKEWRSQVISAISKSKK